MNAAHTDKQQHLTSDLTPYFGALLGGLVPYVAGPAGRVRQGGRLRGAARLSHGRPVRLARRRELLPLQGGLPERVRRPRRHRSGREDLRADLRGGNRRGGGAEQRAPELRLPTDGKETALFGEATWRFTDKWRVTAGGRYYDTKIDLTNEQFGFLKFVSSGNPSNVKQNDQKENGFTPKFSIAFAPDRDTLFYALVSQGFRFGGANLAPPNPQYPTPGTFGSDSLVNYESAFAWRG